MQPRSHDERIYSSRHRQSNNGRIHSQPEHSLYTEKSSSRRSAATHPEGGQRPDHSSSQTQSSQYNDTAVGSSSSHYDPRQQYDESYYWHAVPRPWSSADYGDRHNTLNPAHNASSSRYYSQEYAATNPPRQQQDHTHRQRYEPNEDPSSRRLTESSLQHFNDRRPQTTNTNLWINESQAESAWNGVEHVRMPRKEGRRGQL